MSEQTLSSREINQLLAESYARENALVASLKRDFPAKKEHYRLEISKERGVTNELLDRLWKLNC